MATLQELLANSNPDQLKALLDASKNSSSIDEDEKEDISSKKDNKDAKDNTDRSPANSDDKDSNVASDEDSDKIKAFLDKSSESSPEQNDGPSKDNSDVDSSDDSDQQDDTPDTDVSPIDNKEPPSADPSQAGPAPASVPTPDQIQSQPPQQTPPTAQEALTDPATHANFLQQMLARMKGQAPQEQAQGFSNDTVAGLQQAQDEAAQNRRNANMGRAGANLGRAIAGIGSHTGLANNGFSSENPGEEYYKDAAKIAGQPVQDYMARTEQEKNDPNSSVSMQTKAFVAPMLQKLGIDTKSLDGASYNSLEKSAPWLVKQADAQQADETNRLKAKELSDSKRYHDDMLLQGRQIASDSKAAGASDKSDSLVDKLSKSQKDDLDPNKARGGNLAKSQAVINASDRVNALFSQFPDGNIPKGQTVELATAVAGMISGGSPQSQHQIDQMVPETIRGQGADAISKWITGEPQGRQQQAFMQMLQETAKRERDVANSQVVSAQIQRMAAHQMLKNKAPDVYNANLKAYGIDPDTMIDKNGRYAPPAPQSNAPSNGPHKPGDIVNIKGKGQFKVGADGNSLEPL